ncbi:MAG: glutamine-hydrolyzing carbamoyl-phosphate synthase small subunit [Spirochaetaceae bacterium]|nr:glutamine-hydrolyzing carbamoyl-phosphate synthase small subunit [Spirochaetaceae bacterium]MDT8297401.1 glutamine-hydrolyzing carbamoyl-phosphate synthase small subunit [Spirochaetaceae bacterium]
MNSNANLILDDGSVWPGRSFGAQPPEPESLAAAKGRFGGEVIFNTGMTGYHEILTDPSYTGQIVMMTYPHIGNYGDDDAWSEVGPESGRSPLRGIKAQGLVVRSFHDGPVPEGRLTLSSFLSSHMVPGISEVDTRGLTLKTRREGSRNGVIVSVKRGSLARAQMTRVMEYLESMPSMDGRDLTGEVGIGVKEVFNPDGEPHVALLDCGVKMNILRELTGRGCRVTVLPSGAASQDVLDLKADALLLSNGPGDPEPLESPASVAKDLMGRLPLWGICLGHQILSRAAGGRTYKMSFGHHGVNHPVRDESTGRVFVTSQNHGFAVDEKSLPEGFTVRFRNANDGSVEGLENKKLKILCVQHHPEASPGPVDSSWIFDSFLDTIKE